MAELTDSTRTAVVRVALRRVFGHNPGEIKAAIDELPPDLRSGPRGIPAAAKVRSVLEAATASGMSEAEIAAVAQIGRHRTGEVLRDLLAAGKATRDSARPRRWLPVTGDGGGG